MNEGKQKQSLILAVLVISLIAVNHGFLGDKLSAFLEESKTSKVERVIDGDTLVIEENEHVRLLGINTPERNEPYYLEAKEFLEERVLNKTVKVVYGKEKKDQYGRTLGYILLSNENVNIEIVENGLGNYYFPGGKDRYYDKFKGAWDSCINSNKNLCEKSANICANCIRLKNLDYKTQKAVFYNSCPFSCQLENWTVKDEGRKKFTIPELSLSSYGELNVLVGENPNAGSNLFWQGEKYVWTSTGDTLFLRDNEGNLVLWKNY